MIALLIISLLLAVGLLWFAIRHKQLQKKAAYEAEQHRLDTAREEAIRTGNIFSDKNLKQVEERLKITHPHLNRRQRKDKAQAVKAQFISDVKAGIL